MISERRAGLVLRILGGVTTLYLTLWALTATLGIRQARDLWEAIPLNAAVPMAPISAFDPAKFRPPKDDMTYYHVGRLRSPCPFLVSADFVTYDKDKGEASRFHMLWFFGELSVRKQETTWSWKR